MNVLACEEVCVCTVCMFAIFSSSSHLAVHMARTHTNKPTQNTQKKRENILSLFVLFFMLCVYDLISYKSFLSDIRNMTPDDRHSGGSYITPTTFDIYGQKKHECGATCFL